MPLAIAQFQSRQAVATKPAPDDGIHGPGPGILQASWATIWMKLPLALDSPKENQHAWHRK